LLSKNSKRESFNFYATIIMVGLFLALSLNVCSEEKPKDKAKDKSDNKATIVGEVLDPYGEPVSDVTIVMAASMMTMRQAALFGGDSVRSIRSQK